MRVFVLGAGASVHAGYPLTKDLGRKLVDWAAKNPPPENFPSWIDADELANYGSLDDIEEVVTKLEASKSSGYTLTGLREALCAYFDSIRPVGAHLYRRFAETVVGVQDLVISFNYDLSLELELKRAGKWEVSDGYGFDLAIPSLPRSPLRLLKLHGSTNWTDLLFGGARGFFQGGGDSFGERPVFPWGLDHLGYPGITDPKHRQGGSTRSGSLVLPSREKKYYVETSVNPREREEFWNSLWSQAADALRQAREMVVVGYSLPEADKRARNLLLDAQNSDASITICCMGDNERLGSEFLRAGCRAIRTDLQSFEHWLDAAVIRQKVPISSPLAFQPLEQPQG